MRQQIQLRKLFYRMAAIAAFVTVATNLYIHLTDFPSSTFEERVLLFQNKAYVLNRIIIIVHWSSITLQPLVMLWAGVWIIQNTLNKNQHAIQ